MICEAVVLAAGHGTRMKSSTPKMLHPLLGRPLLQWAVNTCAAATDRKVTVVVGPEADPIRAAIEGDVSYAVQHERLGTAHAVLQAQAAVGREVEAVLIVNGDLPLLRTESLARLIQAQASHDGPLSLLTGDDDAGRGFGRILRDSSGAVVKIQEAAQATAEQLAISELNVGAYCCRAEWLWQVLPKIQKSPAGEYYLTDMVELAATAGGEIAAAAIEDRTEMIGVNNRVHLAEAEAALRQRINRDWMMAGVTLQDPDTTYIEPTVDLQADTTILAGCHLQGDTTVASGSVIGPNSIVRDSSIGPNCEIQASVVEGAELEGETDVGPFSHLRQGARLGLGVHIGNYGEVKNSQLGPGVKVGHFSYLGDATVGAETNIGAGTITCNFDGARKHETIIGEAAFIGSDTMLVAPVRIGHRARTGAGAVVTKDVPDDSMAVGVPARVIRKLESSAD